MPLRHDGVVIGALVRFGERFRAGGRGVHDIHQNQGDPAGSRLWQLNGIWQDAAVAP